MNAQVCLLVITFLAAATLALGTPSAVSASKVPPGVQISPPNPNLQAQQPPIPQVPDRPGPFAEAVGGDAKTNPDDLNAEGTFGLAYWGGGGWGGWGGYGGWGSGWGGWGGWGWPRYSYGWRYPYYGWGSYRPYGWGGWGW